MSNIARTVCAVNLPPLASLLNNDSMWAFSLASDASTHRGKSYFDNRIRFYFPGKIYNFHAIAIPMFSRHTAENVFRLVSRFLDILYPSWRTELIELGSDGANVTIGEYNGVLTKLEQQVQHKIYRVWCALHQLDLVMKYGYAGLMNDDFIEISNKFITHLHDQDKLIQDMDAICTKLSNRWIVIGNVCEWFIEHRREVSMHIAKISVKETKRTSKNR